MALMLITVEFRIFLYSIAPFCIGNDSYGYLLFFRFLYHFINSD